MTLNLKQLKDVSYFELNNEINRPVDDQIPLYKDQEALKAFFKENVYVTREDNCTSFPEI